MKARRLLMAIAGGAVLWAASEAGAWQWVHSKQWGEAGAWFTLYGEKTTNDPVFTTDIEPCDWYALGELPLPWHTDVLWGFHCDELCYWTYTSFYAGLWDGSLWDMHTYEAWADLGLVGPDAEIMLPGMNLETGDLYVAIDMLEWLAEGGEYEMTWHPEELVYYEFVDGISTDLPGVFVSSEPIYWEPGAPGADLYHGWFSEGWYTGQDVLVCHEFSTVPEPACIALLGLSVLAVRGRRRHG